MASKNTVSKKLRRYRSKRDFSKTREPAGGRTTPRPKASKLKFVIQKHAASHLHFDLRLELDGVMKSWAVPKGPSLDPSVKRLAMEVEDHPMEYNKFEGTIPEGEYGGGTVMLWDRGTYSADKAVNGDHAAAIRVGYQKGKIDLTFHGSRLQGSFALVRTRTAGKPQWLLIKHRDEHAAPGSDVVVENMTSVRSGRTMEEIAGDRSRVWHSNRPAVRKTARTRLRAAAKAPSRAPATASILPMFATQGSAIAEGDNWTFEPKYDGIRVLAYIAAGQARLITRNAKDKTAQFPEVVEELADLPGRGGEPLVLDGEIVALQNGRPGRFQHLQGRMHVTNTRSITRLAKEQPAVFIAFDLLLDGNEALLHEPWSVRRARLKKRLGRKKRAHVWLAPSSTDAQEMLAQARQEGWEGVIAKDTAAAYRPGQRSRSWLKLKLEKQQEFVVGGFTEPRRSREHIGSLLLGYYNDDGKLVYAGHVGTGFTQRALKEMYSLLRPLERDSSPFTTRPRTNEKAHWVEPEIVVAVRYNEMTKDGKLRQPVFLGIRDDKNPEEVRLETS